MTIFEKSDLSFSPVGGMFRIASLQPAVSVTIPEGASGIMLQADTANVRYTFNGSTPSGSLGFIAVTNNKMARFDLYPGAEISFFSTTGAINYYFFKTNR